MILQLRSWELWAVNLSGRKALREQDLSHNAKYTSRTFRKSEANMMVTAKIHLNKKIVLLTYKSSPTTEIPKVTASSGCNSNNAIDGHDTNQKFHASIHSKTKTQIC